MTKSRRNYLLVLVLAYAALGLVYATCGYERTWKLWNLPYGYPPFMDARVITVGATAYRDGIDPMVANPADVAQRRLNYPRIWQGLYRLGVDERHGLWLGLAIVTLFAVGTGLFVREPGVGATVLVLAGVFSPAVMLGVERGNTDLLMFFFVAAAVVAAGRGTWLALGLILVAFGLKLFPLAALALLLGRPREEAVKAIAIGAALAVLYLLYCYGDLLLIRDGTPEGAWIAFGRKVVALRLDYERHPWASLAGRAGRLAALAAMTWGARALGRREGRLEAKVPMHLTAFRAGAACYVGAFLLGSNFDYRLVFLLFTMPQLAEWATGRGTGGAGLSRAALAAMLVAMWGLALERAAVPWPRLEWVVFLVGEVATWVVFVALVRLAGVSLPGWVAWPERWRGRVGAASMAKA